MTSRSNLKYFSKGNCGYDLKSKKYESCQEEDKFCGLLHCQHLSEKLEFGMESHAIMSHFYMNINESIIACRTALVDLGSNHVKIGLVPNGAKCGEGKVIYFTQYSLLLYLFLFIIFFQFIECIV